MSPRVAPRQWRLLFLIVVVIPIPTQVRAVGSFEGEALYGFRRSLIDPNGVLLSWDGPLSNPCSWFHITCNSEKSVIQLKLGNAGLSGTLVPELGILKNLQYLELYNNKISGRIPKEFGDISALVSMDLFQNKLTGSIPESLGQLSNLRFLRLNNNSLNGSIPVSLAAIEGLQVLDLSYNNLSGEVPTNGSFSRFSAVSFIGNKLCGSVLGIQCPGQPPFPLPGQQSSPQTQAEPKDRNLVIVLASTISAAALMLVVIGFTFIICRKQKHSRRDLQRDSKVADVEARKF